MTTEQTEAALEMKKGARGRKDKGQEAVIKLEAAAVKIEELVELKKKADEATAALNDGVKAAAEQAGLLATVVRSFVNARASDKYDDAKTKAQQLALMFDEIGENTKH
jgi:hypothetical protein